MIGRAAGGTKRTVAAAANFTKTASLCKKTVKLARALALAASLLAAPAAAHPSRGIAVDERGTVYFSDLIRVWRIDGARLRLVRRNPGTHTHALAIDPAGRLVWEESAYDPARNSYAESIWQLAGNRVSRRLGPLSPPPRGLGITFDRAGCSFHADQAARGGPALVHRWCRGRPSVRLVGTAADDRRFRPALVNDIGGTALAADGRFVFRHGGMVRAVGRRGRVQLLARNVANENFGIALDPAGALLVAEHGKRRVLRVVGGRATIAARSPAGWGPTGVAAGRGFIVLLEASDHRRGEPARMRVRRIAGGRSQVLAEVAVPQP